MAYRLSIYNQVIGTFDYDQKNDKFLFLSGDTEQLKTIIGNFMADRDIEVNATVIPRMKRDLYGMLSMEEIDNAQ